MIKRNDYLASLFKWKDEKVIKVITGVRRCGKSTLLAMFQDELRKTGVDDNQIISLNFENIDFDYLKDYKKLYSFISEKLLNDKTTYIFLDEIQLVPDFQKAVDSLYIKDNVDIYITGSNAYLLSGELATLLSGRYIEINMLPLSFKEYCDQNTESDSALSFANYQKFGGMPYVACLDNAADKADTYLEGIYNTIIVKDIEERQRRKEFDPNKRKINDIGLLKNISRFLAASVGSPVSYKSISNYITSAGRKVSQNTISDYVDALTEPYVFYPVERFDIEGKQLLKQNKKLYIVDLGLRNHLISKSSYDLGFSLENTVYFELLRRGYTVNIGKIGQNEIDFVARKCDDVEYYQVTASMTEKSTFNREMAPLNSLSDNYPKFVLTLDRFTLGNYNGIIVINAIDWLLA